MKSQGTPGPQAPKYSEKNLASTDNYYYQALKTQEKQHLNASAVQDFQNSKTLTIAGDEDFNQKNRFQLIKSPPSLENSQNRKRAVTPPTISVEDQKRIHNRKLSNSSHQREDERNLHYSQLNTSSTRKVGSDLENQLQEQVHSLLVENQALKIKITHLEKSPSDQQGQEKQFATGNFAGQEPQIEFLLAENEQLKANLNEQTQIIENAKKDLDKLMETISLIEEQNKKLTNEKECLLEYMEGLSNSLERSQREIRERSYETQHTEGEGSLQNIQGGGRSDSLTASQGSEGKIQRLNQDLKELSDLSSVLQQQLKLLATENARITGEAANWQKQCNSILREKNELVQITQRQQDELLRIQQENTNLIQVNSQISKQTQLLLSEQDIQKRLLGDNHHDPYNELLDQQLETEYSKMGQQDKDVQIRGLLKEVDQLRRIVEAHKIKLEQERNSKTGEIRSLYEQYSELRGQMSSLQQENLDLFTQNNGLKEQLAERDNDTQAIHQQLSNKERDIQNLQVKLEKSNQKIHELSHAIQERDFAANELKNEITGTQEKMLELQKDCEDVHRNRENLIFEQKKQRELISKLKEQLAEKDEIIFNEMQDKDKANKQFENTKKDLIELTKILESGLSEEERRNYALPQLILNGSDVFIFVHERIRAVLLEKEKNKSRIDDLAALKDRILEEKAKLEKEKETFYKNQLMLQNENEVLNKEIMALQNRCQEVEQEYVNMCEEAEKQKNALLTQVNRELEQSSERLREREEAYSKLETKKFEMQFTIDKLKESTINKNIVNMIDEIKGCHFELLRLQSERNSLKTSPDLQDSVFFSFSDSKKSPKFNESTGIKRKLEELKNAISTTDIDIQTHRARKQSLEQELSETISRERVKSSQYNNLEKITNQLKSEINILSQENELIERAKFDLENSYHDLLRESSRKPQKSPLKDRSNLSFIQPRNIDFTEKKPLR